MSNLEREKLAVLPLQITQRQIALACHELKHVAIHKNTP